MTAIFKVDKATHCFTSYVITRHSILLKTIKCSAIKKNELILKFITAVQVDVFSEDFNIDSALVTT